MNFFRIAALFTSVLLLNSCADSRYEADTSQVNYSLEIKRLDEAVFALDPNAGMGQMSALQSEYGEFLSAYFEDIMRIGPADNPMTPPLMAQFTQDPNWSALQKDIIRIHPDLTLESAQLEAAFKNYGYWFQTEELPDVAAYNSGFNVGIFPTDEWLGVGLEWYSGSDLPIINQLPPDMFPQYKRDKMQPEFLVPNALKGWLMVKHQDEVNGETLLNRLVYTGKIHFLAEKLLDNPSHEVLFNYSTKQVEWCNDMAFDIWKYFLENDLLFSEDLMQINKLVGDGPFTPGMPPESPGGVGNWVGYKMVSEFMERNEDVSLRQLFEMKNDQRILKYYKP